MSPPQATKLLFAGLFLLSTACGTALNLTVHAFAALGVARSVVLTALALLCFVLVVCWLPGPWHGGPAPLPRDLLRAQLPWWALLIVGVLAFALW